MRLEKVQESTVAFSHTMAFSLEKVTRQRPQIGALLKLTSGVSLSLSLLLLFPLFVHPLNTEFPGSPLGILGLSPPEAGANAVTRGPRTAARSWHTSVMGIKSWAKTANGGEQLPHGEKATGSGGGSDNRFSLIGKDPILYTFKERNINKIPMIIQHINGLQFKRSFRSTEVICLE